MPKVVALVAGLPSSAPDVHVVPGGITLEVIDAGKAGPYPIEPQYDLLVLAGMTVGTQQQWVEFLWEERRWRLVPVLYLVPPETIGMPIPGSYRPEIDGIIRAAFGAPAVLDKIVALAKDGVAATSPVVAGAFELDPLRCRLQVAEFEVELTEREAEIFAVLLNRPNFTVTATEIVELGWGASADPRHLQNLRRHMSNIRRKLDETSGAGSVQTIRGIGYKIAV